MRHPNITQLMGVSIGQEEICIVTEFIARGSLFRLLHMQNVQIEEEHIRKFAQDCCTYPLESVPIPWVWMHAWHMGWDGMGWDGMGWDGMGWDG
jgi:hypothetical protein